MAAQGRAHDTQESHAMKEIIGNIWDYQDKAIIVITTNGLVGKNGLAVFGRGCARQGRERFPDLPARLGSLINAQGNHVFYLDNGIVSFPVEHTPYETPDLRLIERSAGELATLADKEGWSLVIVPRPGCGGGGLDWREVKPVLESCLDDRFVIISQ